MFERAAEQGHINALFSAGAMHGGGHEVPENRPLAQAFFRRGAERGQAMAQLMLGRYLARGVAGQTDLAEARLWLQRARAQGIDQADAELARLAEIAPVGSVIPDMVPKDIAQAGARH
jgi:TPR repeat protein